MLCLMPHSTCARDDVPDWLRELMPCPERPAGMRVEGPYEEYEIMPWNYFSVKVNTHLNIKFFGADFGVKINTLKSL